MSFFKVILAVCAIGMTGSAQAAEWWRVSYSGSGNNEKIVFIDRSTIRTDKPDTNLAWSYWISETPDKDGERKSRVLDRYDCQKRTTALLAYTSLGNNNKYLNSFQVPAYKQEDSYVAPDTIGESMWRFVCEGPSGDQKAISPRSPDEFAAYWFKL